MFCSTYFVLCLLSAPIHQNKFQVGVNLLGNKYYSDSDSKSDSDSDQIFFSVRGFQLVLSQGPPF